MKKRITTLLLTLAMAASLAGCGGQGTGEGNSGESGGDDLSEHVDLTMYLIGSEKAGHQKVMDALNEKLEEDLNCSLTVKYIGFGEFDTKYPLVLSGGEEIDLIYTSAWLNYAQMAEKGAYLPLEDLLPKYAPESTAETDMDALKQMDDEGHIYFLPSNHPSYSTYGFITRGDVMKEYGVTEITNMDEYLDFTTMVNKDGVYKDSLSQSMHNLDEYLLLGKGYYPLTGGTGSPYWVKPSGEDNYTVYNKIEIPELQDFLMEAQERCNEGAWSQSVLSNTDAYMVKEGLSAATIHNVDQWIDYAMAVPEADLQYTNYASPIYEGSIMQDAMAVPVTSKHPERALMVLEKLRQDESYYALLTWGIEGEHYELMDDGTIKIMNQDDYMFENGTWGFRDDKFHRLQYGAPANAQQVKDDIAANATENIFKSYVINTEPIKNEYAAVQNAMTQYFDPLALGYVDYESGKQDLEQALSTAGDDKCKEELQKQVDEFVAKVRS